MWTAGESGIEALMFRFVDDLLYLLEISMVFDAPVKLLHLVDFREIRRESPACLLFIHSTV